MKFSSLAALEVVILTTSIAANGENFIKMKIFLFQLISTYGMNAFLSHKMSKLDLHINDLP